MELAVLPAGIDFGRKVCQQCRIEVTAGEFRGELSRIHADQLCAKPAVDHVSCELICRNLPYGEDRFQAGPLKLALAVGANVGKEEVAKGDSSDALRDHVGTY